VSRRQLVFRLLALALVPALLIAGELTLRASEPEQARLELPGGWEGDARVVSDANRDHPLEAYVTPEGEARVRTARAMLDSRFMHPVDYAVQRPEGVLRVFCFGGSATLGVPVEATPERTFPGQLATQLEAAGLSAEVINLGGASFGSDRVVELMAQAVQHQPSALVVYSGNNEFFEYALALHQANLQRADTVFERRSGLRLVRWLWKLSDHAHGADLGVPSPDDLEQRQQALVRTAVELEMASDPSAAPRSQADGVLRRQDSPYRAVMARYAANLGHMVELADGVAPLVLVAVPANLHHAPFQAAHGPSVTASQVASWRALVDRAELAKAADDLAEAERLLGEAIALDPIHAQAHFLRGLVSLAGGDLVAASRDLHNALELDLAPGRPVLAQAEAVRSLGDPPGVLVVDPGSSFEAHGLAGGGASHFHDACHLTPDGYGLLARHVLRILLVAQIAPVPSPQETPAG
jgi:tetratricopeptide (TPR) repeat protein